ncbi:siderophore-interacting protein [Bartonella apis]|uniref:siderophore-interacting protein n=1 Tax=Bartonella apis TaxID=1686310 RepID=UPI0026EEFA06|nr:siderophore-interacting protein [Bartonella apis]
MSKDPFAILDQEDHMRGMEKVEMRIVDKWQPFANLVRVKGRINPTDSKMWQKPNVAVRIDVETIEGKRPTSRVYTVRKYDPSTQTVEIDFVIHKDGLAMRWLNDAKIGSTTFMVGPRPHFIPDENCPFPTLFFADETAIPAIYSILQQWPKGEKAKLYIECGNGAAVDELPKIEGVEHFVYIRKQNEEAGKTGYLVKSAESYLEADKYQIWVACEREETRKIRKHFMNVCALPKDKINAIGYWRYGTSSTQIDAARLEYYTKIVSQGNGLEEFDEFDLPI